MLAALLGIVAGCLMRSFGLMPLYTGTLIIGLSLSLLGVLTPVVVKRDFPHRVGQVMGLYTMLISFGAAASTATAAPIHAVAGSWQLTLLVWALPALVAAVVFIPQLFRHKRPHGPAASHVGSILADPIAWQVTGFLALVSSLAYAVFTWGPSMLQARGLDVATSGVVTSMSYLAQMATGLTVPIIAGRLRNQSLLAAGVVALSTLGLVGFVFAPVWSLPFVSIVLGLGQGGAFGLALSLIVLRSGNPHVAAQLSSMSQTVGYVVGGLVGPFAVGMLHDWSGSWEVVAIFYVVIGLGALVLGLGAGRARSVQQAARARG
jgi:CP family cyanate transporter-like MFS transporter